MLTRLINADLKYLLLAIALGGLYCLGFAPFGFWPVTLVAIAGLYCLLTQTTNNPTLVAWCFGIGKYGVGASWVYVSINVYGGAGPLFAGLLVVLFVLFAAALFCAPLGWLFARLKRKRSHWDALCFAAIWGLMDWSLTWLLTGFPWLYSANAMLDTWFAGWIPVLGVLGSSTLLVYASAAFATTLVIGKGRWSYLLPPLVVCIGGFLLGGINWVNEGRGHSVALIQANIDQALKWRPEEAQPNYQKHLDLTAPYWEVDLIIWPEAAITLYPHTAQSLLEDLARQSADSQTSLVVGIPGAIARDDHYEMYNTALGLGQASGRYLKHHLVPFGEYVPLEGLLRGVIAFFNLPMSSMSAGASGQKNISTHIGQIAMGICYEIAYPESMRQSAISAAVLATISNDTWFGRSIGPHQHMEIARARALENGRWLLRATNNGITAVVNHQGMIVDALPQFEAAALKSEFRVMLGRTPYSWLGHWPMLLFFSGIILQVMWRRYKTDTGSS